MVVVVVPVAGWTWLSLVLSTVSTKIFSLLRQGSWCVTVCVVCGVRVRESRFVLSRVGELWRVIWAKVEIENDGPSNQQG